MESPVTSYTGYGEGVVTSAKGGWKANHWSRSNSVVDFMIVFLASVWQQRIMDEVMPSRCGHHSAVQQLRQPITRTEENTWEIFHRGGSDGDWPGSGSDSSWDSATEPGVHWFRASLDAKNKAHVCTWTCRTGARGQSRK